LFSFVDFGSQSTLSERYASIERENRKLLNKMTEIMSKDNYSSQMDSHDHTLDTLRRLNIMNRQRQLDRVAEANLALLKRIQERPPHYDRREWAEHQRHHQHLLTKLREFPYHPERIGHHSPDRPPTSDLSAAAMSPRAASSGGGVGGQSGNHFPQPQYSARGHSASSAPSSAAPKSPSAVALPALAQNRLSSAPSGTRYQIFFFFFHSSNTSHHHDDACVFLCM
jgi:hypothetical protein